MSGIKGLKCDSGAAKRKRKQNEATLVASMQGTLHRHLIPIISTSTVSEAPPPVPEPECNEEGVAVDAGSNTPFTEIAVDQQEEKAKSLVARVNYFFSSSKMKRIIHAVH